MRTCRFTAWALGALCLLGCTHDVTVTMVSSLGGTPVPGVQLRIDDRDWVETDGNGQASFAKVGTSFVLRVHHVNDGSSPFSIHRDMLQIYRDLGGSEVVLPVDVESVQQHQMAVTASVSGLSGGRALAYLAGDPGSRIAMSRSFVAGDGRLDLQAFTERPAPYDAVVRVLEDDGMQPIGHYSGYAESVVPLADSGGGDGVGTAGLALQPVGEGAVAGTVAQPESRSKQPIVVGGYVRFSKGGSILLQEIPANGAFSFLFPQIPRSEAWLYARNNGLIFGAFHKRRVVVPSQDVKLDLPAPVDLVEPAPAATIGAGTVFRWTGGPPGGRTRLHLLCGWTDATGTLDHLVTVEAEAGASEMPMSALGDVLIEPGTRCSWSVTWTPSDFTNATGWFGPSADDWQQSFSDSRSATFQ